MSGTYQITEAALLKRINRRLAHNGERLCKTRACWTSSVGHYHVLDVSYNAIANTHVDPINLARELGVLHENETVITSNPVDSPR